MAYTRQPIETAQRIMRTRDNPAGYAREIRNCYIAGSASFKYWQRVEYCIARLTAGEEVE